MFWCRHRWEIASISHTEPAVFKAERVQGYETLMKYLEIFERFAKGLTYVALRCTKCGWLKSKELPGIHRFSQGGETPVRRETDQTIA